MFFFLSLSLCRSSLFPSSLLFSPLARLPDGRRRRRRRRPRRRRRSRPARVQRARRRLPLAQGERSSRWWRRRPVRCRFSFRVGINRFLSSLFQSSSSHSRRIPLIQFTHTHARGRGRGRGGGGGGSGRGDGSGRNNGNFFGIRDEGGEQAAVSLLSVVSFRALISLFRLFRLCALAGAR